MNEGKRKTVAILSSTGTAQKRTIPKIRERDICKIVGIHGRNTEKLEVLAKKYAIPYFTTDAAELLDSTHPDFVFIGSPAFMHAPQIRLCAERRIPVLCEKPLCLSVHDAHEIESTIRGSGIVLRVAHHLRHQAGILAVHEIVKSGKLGQIRRASIQWAFWLREEASSTEWKRNPSTGGQHAFFDAGIHAIDLMLYLLPAPKRLAAVAVKKRFPHSFDTVSAVVECGDAIAELSTSQSTRFPVNALTIDFEGGTIHIPHALGEIPCERLEITTSAGTEIRTFKAENPYGEEIVDFIRLLNGEETNATTLCESIRGVEILEGITKAFTDGSTIQL